MTSPAAGRTPTECALLWGPHVCTKGVSGGQMPFSFASWWRHQRRTMWSLSPKDKISLTCIFYRIFLSVYFQLWSLFSMQLVLYLLRPLMRTAEYRNTLWRSRDKPTELERCILDAGLFIWWVQNEDEIVAINGIAASSLTHTAAVELVQNACSPLHLLIKRVVEDKKHLQQSEGESSSRISEVNISYVVRLSEDFFQGFPLGAYRLQSTVTVRLVLLTQNVVVGTIFKVFVRIRRFPMKFSSRCIEY